MKRNLKIFIWVLIVLILVFSITSSITYLKDIKNYDNRQVIQTEIQSKSINEKFTENNSIEIQDLLVQLYGINYYPNGNEYISNNNVLEFNIEFSSKNNSYLNIKSLDYLIFDNNNNILNTSLWDEPQKNKSYIKGFLNEKYQEKLFFKIKDHFIFTRRDTYDNITDNLSKVNKTISCSLTKEMSIPVEINVRILNLEYNFKNSEIKSLYNIDLEFILDFK